MTVADVVQRRRSVRAFLDTPVDMALLRELIAQATRAPSGGNLQPWHITVVSGDPLNRLRAKVAAAIAADPRGEGAEYDVYPPSLGEPYRTRRFAIGEALYASLGIPRDDRAGRLAWFAHNFDFFGAPVGLFVHVDRGHGPPQWSDCGMMLQTLMLLLVEEGLDSCAQEAWTMFHRTVDGFLGTPPERMLFTGMAIGHRDPAAAVNAFAVDRAPLSEVATFLD